MAKKRFVTAVSLAVFSMCGASIAQESPTMFSGVSPIPNDAQERFCYYAGLAYSPNSYLPITIPSRTKSELTVEEAPRGGIRSEAEFTSGRRILLQCVTAAAAAREECITASCKPSETLMWAARATIAVSPR